MNEKELEGAKKLIENKDVKKGSYSFIGNSNITYADIKILLDYIKQLEQENQQLKEQLQQKEEEIKELCKKIKVNEKSRRKMQKSLMEKIQEIEKARKEAITYIKNNLGRKCYFNKEENRYKTNESKVLEILDIEKSDK